jgi:hypothetical protein
MMEVETVSETLDITSVSMADHPRRRHEIWLSDYSKNYDNYFQ